DVLRCASAAPAHAARTRGVHALDSGYPASIRLPTFDRVFSRTPGASRKGFRLSSLPPFFSCFRLRIGDRPASAPFGERHPPPRQRFLPVLRTWWGLCFYAPLSTAKAHGLRPVGLRPCNDEDHGRQPVGKKNLRRLTSLDLAQRLEARLLDLVGQVAAGVGLQQQDRFVV